MDFLGYKHVLRVQLLCISRTSVLRSCVVSPFLISEKSQPDPAAETRFFAGDWGEIHQLLPHARESEMNLNSSSEHGQATGYDVILMAETIYSISSQRTLYGLIKKCMSHPHGVVYMAGKKHYFGIGGGTRQFLFMLEKDGCKMLIKCLFLAPQLLWLQVLFTEVADGSSNVREVWKLSYK